MEPAITTDHISLLLNPVVQYGFAGFCIVLLAIIVWQFRSLIQVMQESNKLVLSSNAIIAKNTETVGKIIEAMAVMSQEARQVFEKMLARPCLLGSDVLKALGFPHEEDHAG